MNVFLCRMTDQQTSFTNVKFLRQTVKFFVGLPTSIPIKAWLHFWSSKNSRITFVMRSIVVHQQIFLFQQLINFTVWSRTAREFRENKIENRRQWGELYALCCWLDIIPLFHPKWLCNVRKLLWIVPWGGTLDLQFTDGSLHIQFNVLKYFPDSAVMLGRGGACAGLGSDVTTGRAGQGRGGRRSLTEV